MKKNLKRLLPYIIINALIYSVIGAIIGKNYAEIRNTRKKIDNDSQALKRFIKEMAKTCPNKMSLDEFKKMGDSDDRKPIEPTPIYIYD